MTDLENRNKNPYYGSTDQKWQQAHMPSDSSENLNEYWDVQMRLGFIRKVYGILSFQLLTTFAMVVLSITSKEFSNFQIRNIGLLYLCIITTLVTSICLVCFRTCGRIFPNNYILLSLFTFCESYLVSAICGITKPELVLMATVMTCGVVLALTYYAYTTKTDFTVMGSMIFVISIVMIMFGIFAWLAQNKIIHIIYSCLGVVAFSIYLVYDTQLIVGNHENKFDIDDYIVGALMLYLDIINLFLHILSLLRNLDRS